MGQRSTKAHSSPHVESLSDEPAEDEIPEITEIDELKDIQTIISSQDISTPTMKEVAKRLGFDVRVISEHFPELCKAISDKHRRDRKRLRAMRIEECCQEVRQTVSTLIRKGENPSEARVSQLISQPGYFRYKKVRMALKEAKSNTSL